MKLRKFDFYLDWPNSIDVINLRQYIVDNLAKKGDLIRWSIIDIKDSEDSFDKKKLRIYAIFAI